MSAINTALNKKLQTFVVALVKMFEADGELKKESTELDRLLERWFEHRSQWVRPYDPEKRGSNPAIPAFTPKWYQFQVDQTNNDSFCFEGYVRDGYEQVYVPVAYFFDPEGWIAKDRAKRVTVAEWYAQRTQSIQTWTASEEEQLIERVRALGYDVTLKQVTV